MATSAVGPTLGPKIVLPANDDEIWLLGHKDKLSQLGSWLKQTGLESLSITDAISESHLAQYQTFINNSRGRLLCTWNLVGTLVHPQNADVGHKMLKRVLALGINPEVEGCGHEGRASLALVVAVETSQYKCAEALVYCQAKVGGRTSSGQTTLAFAREQEAAGVPKASSFRQLVERVFREGYPGIAELAGLREFWAVKNRCRRRSFQVKDALEVFNGKSAIQWAEEYGEHDLANELRYYLHSVVTPQMFRLPQSPPLDSVATLRQPAFEWSRQVGSSVPASNSSVADHSHELKSVQETIVVLAGKIDHEGSALRSELKNHEKNVGDVKSEVNNLRQAQEAKAAKLQAAIDRLEPRLSALEDKVNKEDREGGGDSNNRRRGRTGDPVADVILGLLDNVADIAVREPSIELLDDVLALVKKHKQPAP